MPPKKAKGKKTPKSSVGSTSVKTASSGQSDEAEKQKPVKEKPLSKKDQEALKKTEKAMREKTEILRKEAEAMLEELRAMEEATEKKNAREMAEHQARLEELKVTCGHFERAKARLKHENNKVREAEIWQRYTAGDRAPYPESPQNMHTHLYSWQKMKSAEYMEFALSKCDACIRTLKLLNELIEYPIYASETTVANWKEVRSGWREELLVKIDKACFNMIKNLEANFEREDKKPYIMSFEDTTDHLKLGMSVWLEREAPAVVRLPPQIHFESMDVSVVMPVAFKKKKFILRLMRIEMDPFSDLSMTFNAPERFPLEPDMLAEVARCFQAKFDANESVADREREKVRQARQKVQEAREAAAAAERSLNSVRTQIRSKSVRPGELDFSTNEEAHEEKKIEEVQTFAPKKKKGAKELTVVVATPSESLLSNRKGRHLPDPLRMSHGISVGAPLMKAESSQKLVDSKSIRTGMKSKPLKKIPCGLGDEYELKDIFDTYSMVSESNQQPKVVIEHDSELCFEKLDDFSMSETKEGDHFHEGSVDSLELLLGSDEDEVALECLSIKTLVRQTVLINREPRQRASKQKSIVKKRDSDSISRKTQKRDNKSTGSMAIPKKVDEEILPTASEIFDINEDLRQDKYMYSLVFFDIPNMLHHVNLRGHCTLGGCYFVDVIQPESQPRVLRNGCTVQIFYGEMNIKRDMYEYDYIPPPHPEDDSDTSPVIDQGIQHLLNVTVPLPRNIIFVEPPIVATWDNERKYWTKQHVHHLAINMESGIATFNLGRLWPFAFFVNKYCLFPFLSWNMCPADIGVRLTINCRHVNFEFTIQGNSVCLWNAEGVLGSITSYVEDIIGKFMPLNKLIGKMKAKGLNVFPDEDAFSYIPQSAAKDVVLEDHTYLSMAMESDILEFQSCDWNPAFKRRKVAFHVREYVVGFNTMLRYKTITATSLAAAVYSCNNDESFFDETKQVPIGFCPDTFSLLQKAFSRRERPLSQDEAVQCLTVYDLLSRTKVLSYTGVLQTETPSSSSSTISKKTAKRKSKGAKSRNLKNRRKSMSPNLSRPSTSEVW